MFFRFRSRFRRWLIAWAVLRIVCVATPVAAAMESSFVATEEVGARVSTGETSIVSATLPGNRETGAWLTGTCSWSATKRRSGE